VPHQLVVTSRTIALGHSYWESRFETHLGEHYARSAMDVVRLDHRLADGHLDRILSPTIFSVRTSRRLFRGMVGLTETQSWQRTFRALAQTSRWDLPDEQVEQHMAVTFQLVMEVLGRDAALARRLDPAGESSLRLAKRMRIDVLRARLAADPASLTQVADEHFGLPDHSLSYWETSAAQRPWRGRDGEPPG
jgi:hypothetical protein